MKCIYVRCKCYVYKLSFIVIIMIKAVKRYRSAIKCNVVSLVPLLLKSAHSEKIMLRTR